MARLPYQPSLSQLLREDCATPSSTSSMPSPTSSSWCPKSSCQLPSHTVFLHTSLTPCSIQSQILYLLYKIWFNCVHLPPLILCSAFFLKYVFTTAIATLFAKIHRYLPICSSFPNTISTLHHPLSVCPLKSAPVTTFNPLETFSTAWPLPRTGFTGTVYNMHQVYQIYCS